MTVQVNINQLRLEFSENSLEYDLRRSKRRTIQIIVFPDQKVEVRAPLRTSISDIQKMVLEKRNWIIKKREQFKKYRQLTAPRDYVSGEKHRYLGKYYTLMISVSSRTHVSISNDILNVSIKNTGKSFIKTTLENWYLHNARLLFPVRIEYGLGLLKKHNIITPALKIRKMKSRWGSCTGKKHITLNLELMRYSLEYIDYVVVHELSHLVEHNHSKRFYKVLSDAMPDWKERQQALNRNREMR